VCRVIQKIIAGRYLTGLKRCVEKYHQRMKMYQMLMETLMNKTNLLVLVKVSAR
jgi:hypothetical protein